MSNVQVKRFYKRDKRTAVTRRLNLLTDRRNRICEVRGVSPIAVTTHGGIACITLDVEALKRKTHGVP